MFLPFSLTTISVETDIFFREYQSPRGSWSHSSTSQWYCPLSDVLTWWIVNWKLCFCLISIRILWSISSPAAGPNLTTASRSIVKSIWDPNIHVTVKREVFVVVLVTEHSSLASALTVVSRREVDEYRLILLTKRERDRVIFNKLQLSKCFIK